MLVNVPDYPDVPSAAAALGDGDTLYFPSDRGPYVLPAGVTIDLSRLARFTLAGDGFEPGRHVGSSVIGAAAGDLVRYVPAGGGNSFDVERLDLRNTAPGGTALHVESPGSVNTSRVSRCQFTASGIGLNAPLNCFGLTVECCKLNGSGPSFPKSIGLVAFSHTYLRDLDVTGWGEGLRLAGAGVSLTGARVEACGTGLRLGVSPAGAGWILSRGVIQGISMEACDVAVDVGQLQACVVQGLGLQGSVNAPSGQSVYGVYDRGQSRYCLFGAVTANGTFSRAAVRVADAAGQAGWVNTLAQNGFPGGLAWQYGG